MPWGEAGRVWDALMAAGDEFDIHPAGMLALDVARIEAGLILIEVDYFSSKKSLIEAQKYSPYEIGLGRLVDLKKEHFIGRAALEEENKRGAKRLLMGLDVNWPDIERQFEAAGLAPQIPSAASRVAVPVYRGGMQVGKATSTTWSPTLKKMIALATLNREHAAAGTELQIELTVEAVRQKVRATVRELPFFNPPRKMATPIA
jgi:aminomethyltransferase